MNYFQGPPSLTRLGSGKSKKSFRGTFVVIFSIYTYNNSLFLKRVSLKLRYKLVKYTPNPINKGGSVYSDTEDFEDTDFEIDALGNPLEPLPLSECGTEELGDTDSLVDPLILLKLPKVYIP